MAKTTLYVDIDSTIWPAENEYDKVEFEMYGTRLLSKGWYEPDELLEMYGENFKEIFWRALSPDRVANRPLYPGVSPALQDIYMMGNDIHFLTHTHFPDEMYVPLRTWLRKNLTIPFGLTTTEEANDKIDILDEDPEAWGIIDDRLSTLNGACRRGYKAFGKRQPTNKHSRSKRIQWFDEWWEVPMLVNTNTLTEVVA